MDSPEDNTGFIRMKRDFNSMLSNASHHQNVQFSFSHKEDNVSDHGVSLQALLDKEKAEKVKRVELISAKSKIVKLEMEMTNLQTSNKRARIEYERDIDTVKIERQHDVDRVTELNLQLQRVASQERNLRQELGEVRRDFGQRMAKSEEKLLALQKDKLQLETDLMQENEERREQMSEWRSQIIRLEMELQISQTQVEESNTQLKLHVKKITESTEELKELEEIRLKSVQAEQRIKDLERELGEHSDNMVVTQALKTDLDSLPGLEKELEKLRNDNAYYRETEKNTLILEEQVDSLTKKVKRADDRMSDYQQIQLDNESLQISMARWRCPDSPGSRTPQSPAELSNLVIDLQTSQLRSQDELSHVKSRLQSCLDEVETAKANRNRVTTERDIERARSQQQQELIKKLRQKLLLISKERESYKQILDSYESEVTVNVDAQQTNRVHQLEELIQDYRNQNEAMEAQLGRSGLEIVESKKKCVQLEAKITTADANTPSKTEKRAIQELKEKLIEVELELEKKCQQIDILEARIEERKLQGDYDPSEVKVIHFSMNPAERAQKDHATELQRLREENEKFRHRLKLLEESGGVVEDLTIQVEEKLQEPNVEKELEELKDQLKREEMRRTRLMEVYTKMVQEFRGVCYKLTGFKIDIPFADQYRLTNMYSQSPNDFLLFSHESCGEIQMLETPFSETIQDLIDVYLVKNDSVPAFLSSVTLELFKRQSKTS